MECKQVDQKVADQSELLDMLSSLSSNVGDNDGVRLTSGEPAVVSFPKPAGNEQLLLPRKRGRPPKVATVEDQSEPSNKMARLERSSTGRWKLTSTNVDNAENVETADKPSTEKRRIGRPRKEETEDIPDELKLFACDVCQKRFAKDSLLKAHMGRMHADTDKQFICRFCGKVYHYQAVWHNHEKTHREDCQLKCEQCEYTTTQKVFLTQHVRARHTMEKPFLCDTCGTGFALRTQLDQHRRFVHIRSEQFFCDQCSFSSHSKQCLDVHLKNKHDSDKVKYKCEICGVELNYMDSYRTHMRRHYDEKPYKCEICGRCFTTSSQKSQHMRTHKERTVQCVTCDKKFLSKHHLARHEVIHTGVKSFECPLCSFKCNVQQNLRKHCKETHDLVYPPLRRSKVTRIADIGSEVQNDESIAADQNSTSTARVLSNDSVLNVPSKKIRRRRSRAYNTKDALPLGASSVVVEDGVYPSLSAHDFASVAGGTSWQASLDGVIEEAAISGNSTYVGVTQDGMQVVLSTVASDGGSWTLR